MAEEPLSTTRRALLGAAAALPIAGLPVIARSAAAKQSTSDSSAPLDCRASLAMTWNERLARYRRRAARTRKAAENGWFRAANDRYACERAALEARYGSWEAAGETTEGRAHRQAIFGPVAAAEEEFYDLCTRPMQQAAASLALTPAPDLPALLAKIRVIQELELDELEILGRPVRDVLAEDVEGLLS